MSTRPTSEITCRGCGVVFTAGHPDDLCGRCFRASIEAAGAQDDDDEEETTVTTEPIPDRAYPITFSGDAWLETVERLCEAGYQATLNGVDVKLSHIDPETSELVGLRVDENGEPLLSGAEVRVPTTDDDLTLRIH